MPHESSQAQRDGTTPRHRVALIVADGSNPFEFSVAVEVFGITRPEIDVPWYDLVICAPTPRIRLRESLFDVHCTGTLEDVATADTVIAPNRPDVDSAWDPAVLAALSQAADRGARMVSFCTGAFTLAEAGVLDGRSATTHWMWTSQFRERYPRVTLRPDVLFVEDGPILTSAGSAAAVDLCLQIVRRDHGAAVANAVSKRLVFPGHREGGQQQFIDRLPRGEQTSLEPVLTWARARLHEQLTVSDLATRAALSPSTLHRRFRQEVDMTPLGWLVAERISLARDLLESTALSIEHVASRCGLGSATNLRTHFSRHVGLCPSDYRRARAAA